MRVGGYEKQEWEREIALTFTLVSLVFFSKWQIWLSLAVEPVAFSYATEKCKNASSPLFLATIFAHTAYAGNLPRISHVFHPTHPHSPPHYFLPLKYPSLPLWFLLWWKYLLCCLLPLCNTKQQHCKILQ